MFYQITDSDGIKSAWVESDLDPHYFRKFLQIKGYFLLDFQAECQIRKIDTEASVEGIRLNEIEDKVKHYEEMRRSHLNMILDEPVVEEDIIKSGLEPENYEYLGEFVLYGNEPKRYYGKKGYKEKAEMIKQLLKLDVENYRQKLMEDIPDVIRSEIRYLWNPKDFYEESQKRCESP